MISFIVIGRNEEDFLYKCFTSILKSIEYNKFTKHEIIYVDSNSTDSSISIAKQFNNIKICKITKKYNASVARNIGANNSKGDVLLFIDGDMEINPSFLKLVFDKKYELIHPFLSGQLVNQYYSTKGKFLYKEYYYKSVLEKDNYEYTTGGIFIIKKVTWYLVNGMRNEFRRSQDLDLGLRLAKKRILLLRKKEVIAKHNTISYLDRSRLWQDLIRGDTLYRSLIYRKNFFNIYAFKRLINRDLTLIILFFFIVLFIYFQSLTVLFAYLLLIIFSGFYRYKKEFSVEKFFYIIARDCLSFFSFFFFSPPKNKNYHYFIIK